MEKIKENTTFKEGDVVVYGSQGICRITGTEKMRVGGKSTVYFILNPVYRKNSKIFVPSDNEKLMEKMHSVIEKDEIDGREEITKKITEYGCEIGNHTYGHVVLTKTDNENALRELAKNDEVIFDTVGIKPSVVRPPCGCYNDFIRQNEKRPLVMWTIDTRDWSHQNKDRTVNTVLSSVKDGDIVLMHDLFVPTAEASEILIPELVNRGFQLVTVSELINYRGEINGTVLNNG